jgi:phosphopentomutase
MIHDRVVLIVLDSVGAGFLEDAGEYGDLGANTLGHIGEAVGLSMPNCGKLGLGNITDIKGTLSEISPSGIYGKVKEKSKGKDTTTGHWEIAGLILETPLPVYPNGFPDDILSEFTRQTGYEVLGNEVASGTEIISRLGDEHVATKKPIVYTSADSVFQIAAHEDVIPLETLYGMCVAARSFLSVGRIIARPFTGTSGSYQRSANRHDFSMPPSGETVLDRLVKAGRGVSTTIRTSSNAEGMDLLCDILNRNEKGLVFINLVDFDMLYGHRRDVIGYKNALEEFDARLPEIIQCAGGSPVIITADHGCDPIFKGTDHTREYIPVLGRIPGLNGSIGVRDTFADIGATVEKLLTGKDCKGAFI